ncbi:MAG: DUF4905 domain-containing protein [Melioribacteraceae bacterium]
MKKQFTYKSDKQIWRILISDSDKLILETRDLNTKEVFFNCYYIENGENIFCDFQLDEKCWVGIEEIYKDIIFFHYFPKPDMPLHKGIIAFDIASQNILWTNNEFSFLFTSDYKVYGFKQGFEERYFSSLDYLTGELIEEHGSDHKKINSIKKSADDKKDWSSYLYPQVFSNDEKDPRIAEAIRRQTNNTSVEGDVDYNFKNDMLFFNYHTKVFENSFVNKFLTINLKSNKVILSEIINANASALFTDSFFIYKKYLFLLHEKNEVVVYELE